MREQHSTITVEERQKQIGLWTAGVFTILSIFFAGISMYAVFVKQQGQFYLEDAILMPVTIITVVLGILSYFMIRRGRHQAGIELLFIIMMSLPVVAILLIDNFLAICISYTIIFASVMYNWVLPKDSRRRALFIIAMVIMSMIGIEIWSPGFRATSTVAAAILPIAIALATMVLVGFLIRQAWKGSLRTKLLTSFLSTIVVTIMAISFFAVFSSGQSQTFMLNKLETAVRSQAKLQIQETVHKAAVDAEEIILETVKEVEKLAEYHQGLYAQSSTLQQGAYWDANTRLTKLPGGQYDNPDSDIASVFIPSNIALNESTAANINTGMYLDFTAPTILQANPNFVAIYFIGSDGVTIYYPNINLASVVPPDFDPRLRPFYSIATPENNPERQVVWTDPYQDAAGNGLLVTASTPVYDRAGKFRGVIAVDLRLIDISTNIAEIEVGESGFAFLVDSAGRPIGMPDAGYKFFDLTTEIVPMDETPTQTILGKGPIEIQEISRKMAAGASGLDIITIQGEEYYVSYAPLSSLDYSLGVIAPVAELDASYLATREQVENKIQDSNRVFLIILVVLLMAATGASLILSQFFSGPIVRLTQVAEHVTAGDLGAQAKAESTDEIGTLANAFNRMTAELRDFIGTLEARVNERTRNLQLAAEVGRTVSQVRDLDVMLKDACELILKEFDLYYVQVYLTAASGSKLTLEAGTGSVGTQLIERGHSLPLDTGSINGRAAVEKRPVVISDTTQSATFRQNPLLPETRGEMAVPLIVGNKVVGVLDMQSRVPDVLNNEVLPAFEALAGQLAVAIQNTNLLAETAQARADLEKQARRLVRTGWNEHLDAIHKPEQIGYVFDRKEVLPLSAAEATHRTGNNAISSSISVTGESLGSLVVELDDTSRQEQAAELVMVVARQVAQHIENLRLLESAERFRYESEQASRRLTHEGWQEYMDTHATKSSGYIYNLNEVLPYKQDKVEQIEESALSLPLKVRDEVIGKLAVKGVESEDEDTVGLINAVAEHLSQHIEGLRLSMQTEQALAATRKQAQREQALRQITSAVRSSTDPAIILRTAARELGSFLGRQTIVHMATAAEVKTGQADHPAEIEGESVANNGNESVSSADRS